MAASSFHQSVALHLMNRAPTYVILLLVALAVCFSAPVAAKQASRDAAQIDWRAIASRRPRLKVLVLVKSDQPLCLGDLAILAERGFVPADRAPGLVLGLKRAVFAGHLGNWIKAHPLPPHLSGRVLERFSMTGIYRVGFEVETREYTGPLELQITAPREGFGKELVDSDYVVKPACSQIMTVDSAGNRWLEARLEHVHYGEPIKFCFGFRYEVDVPKLLDHDLFLSGKPIGREIPPKVQPFLEPGYKIDPGMPAAMAWASLGGFQPPDARQEYRRLRKFIRRNVVYDKRKRAAYFGGRMVYTDLDRMYQNVCETLSRHLGACPDTSLLECTFLRARGIPCRTAGRFGHFFTVVYVPGRGWMSTSVTPTGIPLIRSPGPDHVPYQEWEPKIPLKTTLWEARVRIDPLDENE
jgi:hypothetical protein